MPLLSVENAMKNAHLPLHPDPPTTGTSSCLQIASVESPSQELSSCQNHTSPMICLCSKLPIIPFLSHLTHLSPPSFSSDIHKCFITNHPNDSCFTISRYHLIPGDAPHQQTRQNQPHTQLYNSMRINNRTCGPLRLIGRFALFQLHSCPQELCCTPPTSAVELPVVIPLRSLLLSTTQTPSRATSIDHQRSSQNQEKITESTPHYRAQSTHPSKPPLWNSMPGAQEAYNPRYVQWVVIPSNV